MARPIKLPRLINGKPIPLDSTPTLEVDDFRTTVLREIADGGRLSALFGQEQPGGQVRLWALVAHAGRGILTAFSTLVGDRYPSLVNDCPQAHWFEREIAEQWGVVPEGHPWLKPIRFHRSYRPGHDAWGRAETDPIVPSVMRYFQVRGAEVHEVAVGPVHAGVIEPGSFRFQCHGETVLHLEISLGYQHRGVERSLVGGPNKRTLHTIETLAGDTSVGHALAYCQIVESLAKAAVPPRAQAVRGLGLELERLANHTGDLGALAADVGFLPTSAFCGRLRGDFLNATAHICGNRFGRGLLRPGGVGFDLEPERARELSDRLKKALSDVKHGIDLLWETASVESRFENTGTVSRQACREIGLVGPAARACGVDLDVRHDFPSGIFRFVQIPISTSPTGDVFARAYVRSLEIQRSGEFLLQQLGQLPTGPVRIATSHTPAHGLGEMMPNALVASLVEGWRGEICHVAITDPEGKFSHYKIVDPSFHNWFGLALALRGQQISDFPLCNKSFNLSYCGHDL
jgi:Ni,Fe-hydrogenase III large subunit